jgi:hypothetical protein
VKLLDLVYCADGNERFGKIAIKHGFRYGAQLPNTVYHPVYFADQNWKTPNRGEYMAALEQHAPQLATVLDWERESQFDEVMEWANEAARYAGEVLIIPKVMSSIDRIPETIAGKPVRLAFSVPTRFGGTSVPVWEFKRRPVHLLGGNPHAQKEHAAYMNVVSADGNYAQKMATRWNQFYANGAATYCKDRYWARVNEIYPHMEQDAIYFAFELSCINIKAMWLGCNTMIRFAVEKDLVDIQRIARQWRDELGYVMLPALRTALNKRQLLVADYGGQIVGFVNYWARRDGWQTVYEIAVKKGWQGLNIGKALLAAVPKPVRLKCTVDNPANAFYEAQGMCFEKREAGKKRALNVWITA